MAKLMTLRTFIAIPLSSEQEENLAAIERHLQRKVPAGTVRWVKPANIHITLHFLGDVLQERIPSIEQALESVTRLMPAFTCQLAGMGAFPNMRRPRVIWVGIQDTESRLELLHTALGEALTTIGFRPERRPFSPHLTLGRVSRRATAAEIQDLSSVLRQTDIGDLGPLPIQEVILFRSDLTPSGPIYAPLARHTLATPPATSARSQGESSAAR